MDTSLSSYWVKFFKSAGFGTDVATKHALTFTSNRIKPDMLPDLDKPSLKEMGITLMGDMIAILRYAKKIVEETSCKTFLGNSEDRASPVKTVVSKPIVKKVVAKPVVKSSTISKAKSEGLTKTVKTVPNTVAKSNVVVKKKVAPITKTSKLYSDYIETKTKPKTLPVKRKYEISDDEDDDEWAMREVEKRRKSADSDVECQIVLPKTNKLRAPLVKKTIEQKKTVFHRLGDSMVSSTTSIAESNSNFGPTFTVTGVTAGKNNDKRNSSVFNRLGNKDNETKELYSRHLRNGTSSESHGILKTRTPMIGTKVLTTKPVLKKPVGTMRADEEACKKLSSPGVRQLVRTTKNLRVTESPSSFTRKVPVTGKLASESIILPAKSRLGMTKQVTFNKMATVSHFQKPGVFSRLGV